MTELTNLEQQRITELKRAMLTDYDQNSRTKQIFDNQIARGNVNDFVRVYQRPLLNREWFSDPGHYPAFGTLGGNVARGEINYIIEQLSESVDVRNANALEINKTWLNNEIISLHHGQNEIVLIGSVEYIYQEIIRNQEKWNARYDNELDGFKIAINGQDIPLFAVVKGIIGEKLFFMNKECCTVSYVEFEYPEFGLRSTLSIEIKPYEADLNKMDLLAFSSIYLNVNNLELVKIFSLETPTGDPLII